MENLNRVLLENVLPAHVAEHFLGRNWKNEVRSSDFFLAFFLRVDCLLTHDVTPKDGSACFPRILSTPAHLCNPLQCCKPLVALSTLISSILTSVSLSESNYFFPAAVTPSQR